MPAIVAVRTQLNRDAQGVLTVLAAAGRVDRGMRRAASLAGPAHDPYVQRKP